jgi:anti-anti-sigma factor
MQALRRWNASRIDVNLAAVTFIDEVGLALLHDATRACEGLGGSLRITGMSPFVQQMMLRPPKNTGPPSAPSS